MWIAEAQCFQARNAGPAYHVLRAQKDHIKIRILQNSVSGIPFILGLETRL